MEKVHGNERRLGIIAEDVGIVARSRSHLLALFHLFDRGQKIAQAAGFLEPHRIRRFRNAGAQFTRQRGMFPL
jgi:hypothetical protein